MDKKAFFFGNYLYLHCIFLIINMLKRKTIKIKKITVFEEKVSKFAILR